MTVYEEYPIPLVEEIFGYIMADDEIFRTLMTQPQSKDHERKLNKRLKTAQGNILEQITGKELREVEVSDIDKLISMLTNFQKGI